MVSKFMALWGFSTSRLKRLGLRTRGKPWGFGVEVYAFAYRKKSRVSLALWYLQQDPSPTFGEPMG